MLADQIDWANIEGDQVRIDIGKPPPLSGPPGHVTIQTQFFFNHDLDYLRYGSKGSGQALSIFKMKAARYLDFGLELLVPEQMWINEVCTYDISSSYGISHWWFNRQKFYIDRHIDDLSRKVVRTYMRIPSVVSIKAYSRYGYGYLKEITLRRAYCQEYMIAEKDFNNLYPTDFEDLNLLLLQGHLNNLFGSNKRMLSTAVKMWTRNLVIQQRVEDFQLGIESYRKQLNLTNPRWDAKGFEYKHDYTIIDSPHAIVFPVSNNERKIMRFNETYKFSDGTLTNIMEALDYRVKEYKANRLNPGMNTRFWTDKDVSRSKEFIDAIERRLKTRRIFQNLECFVGGRVRDIDYRLLQRTERAHHFSIHVNIFCVRSSLRSLKPKRIIESRAKRSSINIIRTLFHITCSSHDVKTRFNIRVLRIILVVHIKMEMVSTCSCKDEFITACSYVTNTVKEIMKAQAHVFKLSQL
nr:hypothetical protein [Tanacetum cinerariifolium]